MSSGGWSMRVPDDAFGSHSGHNRSDDYVDIEYTSTRLNEEEGSETESHGSTSLGTDDDPDYSVEENGPDYLEDVEVDMSVFRNNVDADVVEVYNATNGALDDYEGDEQEKSIDFDLMCSDEDDSTVLDVVKQRIRRKAISALPRSDACPFYVGQLIEDKEMINDMVKAHALASRRELYIKKNDNIRYRVVCLGKNPNLISGEGSNLRIGENFKGITTKKRDIKPTCPWAMQISRRSISDMWCVKTISSQHQCLQTRAVGLFTMGAISKEIESEIETNPTIPVKSLQDKIQKKHQIHVSEIKVRRAKKMATDKKDGDFIQQYGMLRAYLEQLIKANPGSHVKIDVEPCNDPDSPTRQFRRVYVCFAATKRAFQMLRREILGLDGCFMKGPFPGQILSAVSIDGNRCIYPVAFSLVEAETVHSWTWFLECLKDTPDLPTDANFTFISDRQKGLIQALERVFPRAEHRFCVRHIHENMKKQWRGDVYKNMFFKAAGATSIPYYLKAMEEIKQADAILYDWLNQIPAKAWSKAHYSGRAQCDIQLNNMCESFNKQLVGARDKPVMTCLEYIREYMTKRIVNVRKMVSKAVGPLTPNATKMFDQIKSEASQLNVLMVDAHNYQVNSIRSQCVVNVKYKTCTCRMWDLTGMPCKHAVAAINDMAINNMNVGIPEQWVPEAYWLDTWKKVYDNQIMPIPSEEYWMPSRCPTTLVPPKHHKQTGRPKKKRKKSKDERSQKSTQDKRIQRVEEVEKVFSKGGKMTRKGDTVKCSKCGVLGHNCRSCTA